MTGPERGDTGTGDLGPVTVTSIHVTDETRMAAARLLASQRRLRRVTGVRNAHVTFGGPLGPTAAPPRRRVRVVTVVAWRSREDFEHATAIEVVSPLIRGWCVLLSPVRGTGPWPMAAVPPAREPSDTCPAVVITVGNLRIRRARSFLRHAGRVGDQLAETPGVRWASALARPPFVGTMSLWERDADLHRFAYRRDHGDAHLEAMAADRATPFHVDPSFVRFEVIASRGEVPEMTATLTEADGDELASNSNRGSRPTRRR